MNSIDMIALLPMIILAALPVVVMLELSFYRSHKITLIITLLGLTAAFILLSPALHHSPRQVTSLLIIDGYAIFYTGLILAATFTVALLSYGYLEKRQTRCEEFYILLTLAALGSAVLASSSHFASFFLGLEILSVSLYGLIAYVREDHFGIEAGIKYLILAATSAAFLLFGMAMIYAESGTMEFARIASGNIHGAFYVTALALIIVGIGFKLALVPFHLWTPDVYQGAPAPVTAFIATVSKGAMFALLLRFFSQAHIQNFNSLMLVFTLIAIASMFVGNWLALLQNNVKRILAYSSISHLGYLLVALLASGSLAVTAVTFYLVTYFVTTLGAFGIITVLSEKNRDAEKLEDYSGLAWRRPVVAGIFTAMLLSLAGIPLTAGFVGKFFILRAGVGSGLWLLVITLVINSAIGLFYYLRVIAKMYQRPSKQEIDEQELPLTGCIALLILTLLLIWLGVYPSMFIQIIDGTVANVF